MATAFLGCNKLGVWLVCGLNLCHSYLNTWILNDMDLPYYCNSLCRGGLQYTFNNYTHGHASIWAHEWSQAYVASHNIMVCCQWVQVLCKGYSLVRPAWQSSFYAFSVKKGYKHTGLKTKASLFSSTKINLVPVGSEKSLAIPVWCKR